MFWVYSFITQTITRNENIVWNKMPIDVKLDQNLLPFQLRKTSFWKFYIIWWTIFKSLRILETCVLVNNNLCGNLVSSLELPTTFDESFEVASVPFFILGFNLFKVLYCATLLKQFKIITLSLSLVKNPKQFLLLLQ